MMPSKRTWACLLVAVTAATAGADDWPTFRHDNHRSGKTAERLPAETLRQQWVWRSAAPPQPAWAGPAKWDAYRNLRPLRSMRNYDPVFHVTAAGDLVWFGSSVDDSVHCLSAMTGEEQWSRTTDGPVRIAPTFAAGNLYVGSDDGSAYCLRADDGSLVWRHSPMPRQRRILNNGRLIPLWPCRTGVLVDGGTAFFAVGMLPWKPSYLCALDARTGKVEGPGRYVKAHAAVTMEGPLLASADRLFVPQGRVPPCSYDRAAGRLLGPLDAKAGGGCFVLLTDDAHLLHGPGNKTGWITDSNARTREKLASFHGGNEMVVDGGTAYLLTDHLLTALERASRKPRWSKPCEYPYALILAGDTLFVGGRDAVAAFAASNGELLWEGKVFGRAYGLAVASGRLLASTDEGVIHCFRPGPKPPPDADQAPPPQADAPAESPARVPTVDDRHLLGRWVFQAGLIRDATVRDLAGKLEGTITGPIELKRVDDVEALLADGSSNRVLLTEDHSRANLPVKEITAEAWVRVDRPLTWGGIVGAIQDNGSFERGWLLGYNDRRFSFAVCGEDGPDTLTYLKAGHDFRPGTWHHVVGTYDGAEMRIYVDGGLEGRSSVQKGPIHYPPQAFYEIGAYHDQDELFPLAGMIHEVRVYRRVLSAEEVQRHHLSKRLRSTPATRQPEPITLALGPYLQFTGPGSATVRWETERPSPSILEYGVGRQSQRLEDATRKTRHEMRLRGLRTNTVYHYAVKQAVGDKERSTRRFECDTFFNYCAADLPAPRPANEPPRNGQSAALQIQRGTPICEGICLVVGIGDCRTICELTQRRSWRVIAVDTDPDRVAAARRTLMQRGLYGSRVTVHQVDSFSEVPFASGLANLIVSESVLVTGECPGTSEEMLRLLRPGGWAYIGQPRGARKRLAKEKLKAWMQAACPNPRIREDETGIWGCLIRPRPEHAGQWSHQYGLPDNSGYGGESLRGARSVDDLAVQWIGRPGPRAQADRNGRKPSPLAVRGRLLMQGLHRIIALDAYNGMILWSLEIPQFERFNMPRDCSNWCADERHVFAAVKNRCWRIGTENGQVDKFYDLVPGPRRDWSYDWGYVARHGGSLIGSAVKSGTAFTEFFGGADAGWYDAQRGEVTHKVCSDNLFALEETSGKTRWTYAGGLIVNPTITIGEGRVYFVECRNPKAVAQPSRRLGIPEFWQDQFLVALEAASGRKLWEKPLDTADGVVVFYLACGDGKLVLVASDTRYHVYGFDAADGSAAWDVHFDWLGKDHGKHMARPAIVGGNVFVRPKVIELASGNVQDTAMPDGGCGTYALTDRTVVFRAGNVTLWDFRANRATSWPRLRPGCWLSTIPACGMLLSPEAGGGCSCGSWLETSIGFMPKPAESP